MERAVDPESVITFTQCIQTFRWLAPSVGLTNGDKSSTGLGLVYTYQLQVRVVTQLTLSANVSLNAFTNSQFACLKNSIINSQTQLK